MSDFRTGDVVLWKRAAGSVVCEVLETKGKRACLRVAGWLGTHWETLDHTFTLAERKSETVNNASAKSVTGTRTRCNAFLRAQGLRFYGLERGWRAKDKRGVVAYCSGHYIAVAYPVAA